MKAKRHRYKLEIVKRAIERTKAVSCRTASKELREEGVVVSHKTIWEWKRKGIQFFEERA